MDRAENRDEAKKAHREALREKLRQQRAFLDNKKKMEQIWPKSRLDRKERAEACRMKAAIVNQFKSVARAHGCDPNAYLSKTKSKSAGNQQHSSQYVAPPAHGCNGCDPNAGFSGSKSSSANNEKYVVPPDDWYDEYDPNACFLENKSSFTIHQRLVPHYAIPPSIACDGWAAFSTRTGPSNPENLEIVSACHNWNLQEN